MSEKKTNIVIGGGLAGIVSALLLKKKNNKVILIEQNKKVGGLFQSRKLYKNLFFDYGSHLYEDGLVDLVEEPEDLNRVIEKNLSLTKQEIINRRNLIWGENFVFNRSKLRMGLDV